MPVGFLQFGKQRRLRPAIRVKVNNRCLNPVGEGQACCIDFAATKQNDLVACIRGGSHPVTRQRNRHVKITRAQRPVRRPARIARHHDAGPPGQWPADRIPCAAAHNQRAAHGQRLDTFQIVRQMPDQAVAIPNHPIIGHCDHRYHLDRPCHHKSPPD